MLGGLAAELGLAGHEREAIAAGDEAIALARKVGDRPLLSVVMHNALLMDWRPDTLGRLSRITAEGLHLARQAGDADAELKLLCKLVLELWLVGDGPRLRAELARYAQLAGALRQPFFEVIEVQFRCMAAIGDGRFAEAEAAAEELERRAEHMERSGGYGLTMFVLRRDQGRLDEVRAPLELLARFAQADGAWGPGLAVAYAEIGMVSEAVALLERLLADGLGAIPRNSMWPGVLSFLADACCATGHRAGAEAVYRELLPYRGLMVCMTGLAYFGAADRYLGRLADVLGRPREALRHLEAALRLDEAAGWSVWTAHSRHALGRLLVQRSRSDDRRVHPARGRPRHR